jgi:plastocyanin
MGYNDAAGAPFWFNGQPSFVVPPKHAFPQGGRSTDGTSYRNSGVSAPDFKPYQLKFTKAGTFRYICLVHAGMSGTVKVLPKGRAVPSSAADRAATDAEYARAVQRAKELARFTPKGNNVVAAHDRGVVAWYRFFPRQRTVHVGQAVRFSISSFSEIHTITFGPEAYRDAQEKQVIMPQPQPAGPPVLEDNPLIFLPSDPALPPYDGSNHGNGYLNTGVLDAHPNTPLPPSARITFTKKGTFVFECTLHPGMEGKIEVV